MRDVQLNLSHFQSNIQGAPKRPDTFESLVKIKPVDENRKCSHFWKAYSMPFCVEYAKHEHYIL